MANRSSRTYGNARLWLGGDSLVQGALEVSGGRITAVHYGDTAKADVDLGGACVFPGLIDAHFHLQQTGEAERTVRLEGAASEGEAAQRMRAAAETIAGGFVPRHKSWLLGGGWDQNIWAGQALPTRASLTGLEQPVVLQRVDYHAVWVNTAALAIAGIDRSTADPAGGRIVRDAAGEATGVLIDNAADLVWRHVPTPSEAMLEEDVRRGMKRCADVGITCVHDMMMTPQVYAILQRLDAAGELTVRVRAYMFGALETLLPVLAQPGSAMLRACGVKLFADGALGSRGAALNAPYSDDPSTSGLLLMQPAAMNATAARIHQSGHQIAIHAIGDRAIAIAIEAIERAQSGSSHESRHGDRNGNSSSNGKGSGDGNGNGGGGSGNGNGGSDVAHNGQSPRHRIEHAQIIALAAQKHAVQHGTNDHTVPYGMVSRFARADVTASMQPEHCACDMSWAVRRLGPERMKGAYAWRSFLEHGVRLAFGSDAPIASADPWSGIRAAVNGPTEQRLTVAEGLNAYTRAAADAANDDDLGALATGAYADFTIVDRDPFAAADNGLMSAKNGGAVGEAMKTLRTVVNGIERLRI